MKAAQRAALLGKDECKLEQVESEEAMSQLRAAHEKLSEQERFLAQELHTECTAAQSAKELVAMDLQVQEVVAEERGGKILSLEESLGEEEHGACLARSKAAELHCELKAAKVGTGNASAVETREE